MSETSTTPLIGVALHRIESPNDVPGTQAADAKASFKLGTTVLTDANNAALFVRVGGTEPLAAGAGVGVGPDFITTTPGGPAGTFSGLPVIGFAYPGDYIWVGIAASGAPI